MDSIRALIVDDEPLTRERVRTLVNESKGLELVGEIGALEPGIKALSDDDIQNLAHYLVGL